MEERGSNSGTSLTTHRTKQFPTTVATQPVLNPVEHSQRGCRLPLDLRPKPIRKRFQSLTRLLIGHAVSDSVHIIDGVTE